MAIRRKAWPGVETVCGVLGMRRLRLVHARRRLRYGLDSENILLVNLIVAAVSVRDGACDSACGC